MARDPDPILRELGLAGVPLDTLTEPQLAVFAALSREEVDLILDIKSRLDEVEPEVQAHTASVAGAALF